MALTSSSRRKVYRENTRVPRRPLPLTVPIMGALAGHVVILTGASEGIGRALALALAPQRLSLVLAARNTERLEELARECEAAGSITLVVPTDVTNEAQCRALVDATVARFGRIDVLVNNAGGTMWSRFDALADLSSFEHLMRLNFMSCVYLTGFALPWIRQTQGRIVAVSSMAGLTGVPERSAYAASKHAMVGFFDSLRIELKGSGVSVTVVAPDFVRSEIHKRALGPDGRPLGKSPMQQDRIMTAEECARLMVRAIERRQRLLLTSARGRLGRWLKLIAPAAIDRIAARAIRERH
jgi:short-subunit dehydrogenase